jgi:hypothetical protein
MNMKKPMVRIHNVDTNEVIDREMTDAEYTAWQADQELFAAEKLREATQLAEKTALLAKLGISADEAKLLLS